MLILFCSYNYQIPVSSFQFNISFIADSSPPPTKLVPKTANMIPNSICVLGSANIDHFIYLSHIPVPGETIQAKSIMDANGGKGSNQAVAAAKLSMKGSHCTFIGQVGHDDGERALKKEMEEAGVRLRWRVLEGVPTGTAFIQVEDKTGENVIVIYGGANMAFPDKVEELEPDFKEAIASSDMLLLQKEIPMHINLLAARFAKSIGKKVMMDCGGRDDIIPQELLIALDVLSPNQTELQRLDDRIKGQTLIEDVKTHILSKYPNLTLLLKMGSKGAIVINSKVLVNVPAPSSHIAAILQEHKIIDTVGAGDCFTAAFGVKYLELEWGTDDIAKLSENYRQCLVFGCSSAFLCITKKGAMPSMPNREQVEKFMARFEIK